MSRVFLLLLLLAAVFVMGCTPPKSTVSHAIRWDSVKVELTSYLTHHPQTPEQYVIQKFRDHDVIFIGERHYIAHDPQLIQSLVPLLHENGVTYLGLEFLRRIDQRMIDSLMSLPVYDESLARDIYFRGNIWWGFQEYVDILKAAWLVNHAPHPGRPDFRVVGINNSPDWSYVGFQKDFDDPHIMKNVWHGENETDWANVILDSAVASGQKMLVYCGIHHAFTRYRQPRVGKGEFLGWGDTRAGNAVFQKIGNRAMTIFLHSPWVSAQGYDQPPVLPADGYIDSLFNDMPGQFRRMGFDVAGTPFADLPGETSIYKFGYEGFSLDKFCDGYIYQGGVASYEPVTVIRDFVNPGNLAYARLQSADMDARDVGPDFFYRSMLRTADVKTKFAHLR